MEVKVMFTETIKPSNPTPEHLRYLRVSLLDRVNSPVLMPLVLFYSSPLINQQPNGANNNIASTEDMVNRLKESLATTLTTYYPLAGQIKDANYFVCNDEGVPYLVARVNRFLVDVVDKAEVSDLDKLLPCKAEGLSRLILTVQVNVFACGGIAIGVCLNHKLVDGFSASMFISTWATIARGGGDLVIPCFDAGDLFPSLDEHPTFKFEKEEAVSKRFVFSSTMLVALQSKYSNGKYFVSTGLALSAFLYARIKAACSPSNNIVYETFQAVNVRSRIDQPPPMNHFYFGNFFINAIAKPHFLDHDGNTDLGGNMAKAMREATKKIDTEFLRKIQDEKEDMSFNIDHFERAKKGEIVSLGFSNCTNFSFSESDFGWGRPVWVTLATLAIKNVIILLPSSCKPQIEAYVSLSKEDMNKLETDHEFNSFAGK